MESTFMMPVRAGSEDGFQDERQREHEFYKYYDAVRSLTNCDTPWTNLFDPDAVQRHEPISSPDTALTAFCQLGALRCGTRRCLLFFFDQAYAYIVAEATRTLSLLDDHSHDVEDGLWLGHTMIPRGLSVCEHTVNIPSANKGSNQFHDNAAQIHIINDLTDDIRFCDRPYVLDGPKARFYAGVPITTPNGLRIGAYCVLDERPRKGLSDTHVKFMLDMSETIMAHLESLRMRTELGTGTRMLTGLGTFVKETPDGKAGQARSQRRTNIPSPVELNKKGFYSATIDAAGANGYLGGTKSKATPASKEHMKPTYGPVSPISSTHPQVCLEQDNEPDGGVGETFERAAALLRDSVDADGVMFLDAAVHSYGGAITGRQCWSDSEIEKEISSSTEGDYASDEAHDKTLHADCRILGSSRRGGSTTDGDSSPGHGHPVPEKILKSLLRHYPKGALWSFDPDGSMSSEENHMVSSTDTDDVNTSIVSSRTRRNRKLWEARKIQTVFPGVRTICLVSMWDNVRERHYAGAIIWTYSPIRQFSSELSYMMAFCDVVMAKVGRLEASMKDQAKSDFISSVSHELRSPLHGILGSIDFLQEQAVLDWSMIAQIEKCSTNLLDVIDHLLDFAKLNHLGKRLRRTDRDGTPRHTRSFSDATLSSGATSSTEVVSLARVTEEVADSTFFSHCYRMDERTGKKVDLILDISMDPTLKCNLAVGAWKRLCINIIGNALKYTIEGHVMISLKTSQHKRRRPLVILTVSDTGIGMSREFLENRLFRAFSQENELANGTGLGMSLVAKLVRGFNARIKVQSAKGSGTTMTVCMPIDVVQQTEHMAPPFFSTIHGAKIGFLKYEDGKEDAVNKRNLQVRAVSAACCRLGASVQEPETTDINFILEADLPCFNVHPTHSELTTPIIVLCDNVMSTAHIRSSSTTKMRQRRMEYIAQPFGPQQLAAALARCLESNPKSLPRGRESQKKAGALKLQLSHRSNTDLTLCAPIPMRPPLARAGSAPPLSWPSPSKTSALELDRRPQSRTPERSASLDIPDTPYLNGRAQVVKDAIELAEATHTVDKPIATLLGEPPEKLSLLLVDDNRINLRLLTTYADKHKHPRCTATNGLEALQAYESAATHQSVRKPDVIFMDINMPLMNGFESARRIRSFENAAGITNPCVIVAVTGLGSNSSQQTAYASGIDIFLSKPVRPRDLTKVLEALTTANVQHG